MIGLLLSFVPFRDPLYGGWNYWYLFLLPLGLIVAMVYKAVRLDDLSQLLPQTLRSFGKLLGVFVGLAVLLWVLSWIVSR